MLRRILASLAIAASLITVQTLTVDQADAATQTQAQRGTHWDRDAVTSEHAGKHAALDPDAFPKMGACQQEDSRQCAWDAVHLGNGFGDSFWAPPAGIARVYYAHPPVHRLIFGDWAPVPNRQIGNRVDLINGGSRLVTDKTIWSLGGTSLWVWPGQDRIDYQIGTS